MPNYNGVWSLSTQFQNAAEWQADNVPPLSGDIALFGGGSSTSNPIDYIQITTLGDAADFGDFSVSKTFVASCSSSTRGVFAGGQQTPRNTMQYVTIVSRGNTEDFGDLTVGRLTFSGCGSSTRGIFGGGEDDFGGTAQNVIDYITIATLGNASDF